MYEFEYEVFDFLKKFQEELPAKIFVIEDEVGFEFYYVEKGIMFSSYTTHERILEHMNEIYGIEEMSEAISLFKQIYLHDISEPLRVNKRNDNEEVAKESQPINVKVDVMIAEKLDKVKFVLV